MNSLSDVWNNVLEQMSRQLSDTTIRTWFDEVDVVTMEDSAFVLHCGNEFKKKTIESRFMKNIREALREIFSTDFEIKILNDDQLSAYHGVTPDYPGDLSDSGAFTFETYVVGPSNKLAYAAAHAVSERPGVNYNPLFIYGDSGLGKTHLLYAISHRLRQNFPDAKVVYIKGDDFTNELVASIREGKNAEFREKYRQATLLLVDDVQFIAGKEQTQEEFFHTFNTLYESGKQIVLTSDRPPREIATLEERLRSRFEMGLLADIQPPDLETRIAIIRRKAQVLDLPLQDDVTEYIANQLKSNVRQLEGVVKRMRAQYMLNNEQPNMITAQNAIRDIRNDNQPVPITVERIISEVARTMGVQPEDIRSGKHSAPISRARQVAAYVVREITNLPMKSIGAEFGGRDHSTIVYAIQKVETQMGQDASFKHTVTDIIKNISER